MTASKVLVTGANGFLGNAVAKAFSAAGWTTYGLVRKEEHIPMLVRDEIIPVIGSAADLSFLSQLPPVQVVASVTENIHDYVPHFKDSIALFELIASKAREAGQPKPLVIFTSGCKDYGMTLQHGDPELRPHTEEDALNPPIFLAQRTNHSLTIFEHSSNFDAILTRPTTFYGRSATFYGPLFALAEKSSLAQGGNGALTIPARPNSIMHGTHVDDVASAYVSLALAPREMVAGQVFNISSSQYETTSQVAEALVKSYGIDVEVVGPKPWSESSPDYLQFITDFSQWVGSEKLRKTVGWTDQKLSFIDGFDIYRRAYELSIRDGDERATKMAKRVEESQCRQQRI